MVTDKADDDRLCWEHIKSITRRRCLSNKVQNGNYVRAVAVGKSNDNSYAFFESGVCYDGSEGNLGPGAMSVSDGGKKAHRFEEIYSLCSVERGTISQINGKTKSKLSKGLCRIDGTVDLHGCTMDIAYETLVDFITHSYNSSRKCVLVITGWGSKSLGENSIKSSLYHWLLSDRIINMVLYYTQAAPVHGGKGAFYVLLRSKNKT
ncbi:MAG: Smr/MutS family protein [Aaplasma endosymbiont of Hyalomma asiaticum]